MNNKDKKITLHFYEGDNYIYLYVNDKYKESFHMKADGIKIHEIVQNCLKDHRVLNKEEKLRTAHDLGRIHRSQGKYVVAYVNDNALMDTYDKGFKTEIKQTK